MTLTVIVCHLLRGGTVERRTGHPFRIFGRWTLRLAAGAAVFITALALGGGVHHHFASRAELAGLRPPGRLVAVEGHTFHLYCTGEGRRTVILESGAGVPWLAWAWIQPAVAEVARVCSYDRAGYGWSSTSTSAMDAENVSQQLHELLKTASIPGPYILVGHSIGGAYARMFTAKFPQDVTGLVLIDATSPSVLETYAEVDLPRVEDWTPATLKIFPYLASVGAMRAVVNLGLFNLAAGLPPRSEEVAKVFLYQAAYIETTIEEYRFIPDTLKQIQHLKPQSGLPVAIVVADRFTGLDDATEARFVRWHQAQQRNWLAISENSSIEVIAGADHISLMTNKLHAHEVANSITKMVEKVSAGEPRELLPQ
ncbi:alpha/beta hydrolase [Methylosinus sp. PW1]|uniref:alpha/beta hydrolase n=1 Tax=Methylosinus sp. PW1 TaxID=107636 RepID=UPI000A0552F9|nr:alpha/beta hydrolase [Methylosinus sp. PW1]